MAGDPSKLFQGLRDPIQRFALRGGTEFTLVVGFAVRRVRLVGMFFDTDKTFLLPSAMRGIRGVRRQYDQHPKANLLIVGHTDTSARDEHNSKLSLERADSIAAYLTDDAGAWEKFFRADAARTSSTWGMREIQLMLSALPEGQTPFLPPGGVDGRDGPETKGALRKFQQSKGLNPDGNHGGGTRRALIEDYMALDGTTLPDGVEITTHGCGEIFPVAETEDGQHSDEDRRVDAFFFDGPITPPPPGKLSKRGSKEYPQWLASVTENVDFTTGADTIVTLALSIFVGQQFPDKSGDLVLLSSGVENRRIPIQSMAAGDPGFVFIELDPAELPDPVEIRRESDFVKETLVGPCSLFGLRTALVTGQPAEAGDIGFSKGSA